MKRPPPASAGRCCAARACTPHLWWSGAAPALVCATLLDEGVELAGQATFFRMLRSVHGRVRERRAQATHPARVKPELSATKANKVWSWDITTKLHGPRSGPTSTSAPSWTCTPTRSSAGWSPPAAPAATPRDRPDQPTRRIRDRSPQVAGFNCPEEVDRFRAAPGAARGGRSGVPSLPAHRRAAPRDGGRSGCGGRDGGVSRSDSRPGLPGRAVRSAPGRPARERCRVRDITPGQRPICTFSAREHTTDGLHAAATAAYAKRDPSAANQPPSTDGEGPDR